jgi:acyl-coenzyme A synthetase/AMP-(fatty) acid ligase
MIILSSNKADTVLPAIQSFQPSMIVAFAETYVFLNDAQMGNYDLSSINLWFNVGDAAHEAHIRPLVAKGHHYQEGKKVNGSIFIDGLGSSEMGFPLFRNVHAPGTDRYDRCVGTPLEWVEAAVLDDDGQTLPPYAIGRLGVKSPTITPGYWNDTNLTRRSQLSGYFLTGDVVYRDGQGRYFHIDRVPDVIRAEDGAVYSLQTEEFLLKHFSEVADLSVVSTQGGKFAKATAIVRLKPEAKAAERELLKMFNEKLQAGGKVKLDAVLFAKPTDIPLGPTGKVLKRELRGQKAHLAKA